MAGQRMAWLHTFATRWAGWISVVFSGTVAARIVYAIMPWLFQPATAAALAAASCASASTTSRSNLRIGFPIAGDDVGRTDRRAGRREADRKARIIRRVAG